MSWMGVDGGFRSSPPPVPPSTSSHLLLPGGGGECLCVAGVPGGMVQAGAGSMVKSRQ